MTTEQSLKKLVKISIELSESNERLTALCAELILLLSEYMEIDEYEQRLMDEGVNK